MGMAGLAYLSTDTRIAQAAIVGRVDAQATKARAVVGLTTARCRKRGLCQRDDARKIRNLECIGP
jgi:hypothetical protein